VRAADQLKSQGDEGAVHEIRGDILLSIRLDAEQAVAEYKEALTVHPKNPELLKKIAEAYFSQGNMQSAGQSAEEALALNPHRTELLKLLAQVAMSERDYPSALSRLSQLAQVEPEDAWVRVQQGTAYAQTGHPDQAVERLEPALDAGYADEKGALHALLAGQLRKLGRDQEARTASDEAVKLADAFQLQTEGMPNKPQ
jgi:tetratricopeptide (TPR) repeat protein